MNCKFKWTLGWLILFVSMASCGSMMTVEPNKNESVDCPDGSRRLKVDCNAVSSLKERVVEANVGLPKIGLGFSGSYEERALGQISESTQQMAVGFEAKCRQYNACAISAEQWTGSEDNIRRQLTTHVELVASLEAAPTPERQELGSHVWSNAVPALAAERLSLVYALEVKKKGAEHFVVHHDGEPLHSGDEFRLRVRTNQPAHVYVLLLSSQGETSQLFPSAAIRQTNPIAGNVETLVPDAETGTFELDNVVGSEYLQIIASKEALVDIENRLLALETTAGGSGSQQSESGESRNVLVGIGELLCDGNEAARARGVNLKPSTVDCGGIRSRGVRLKKKLANVAAQKVSPKLKQGMAMVARPNDNTVVWQHLIVHQ